TCVLATRPCPLIVASNAFLTEGLRPSARLRERFGGVRRSLGEGGIPQQRRSLAPRPASAICEIACRIHLSGARRRHNRREARSPTRPRSDHGVRGLKRMDAQTRRRFIETVAAAGTLAAISPGTLASGAEPGFRGTLCFFSKHLPKMDAPRLGRTLKTLGFGGVDLTVRPGGHIDPTRVATDLPPFVAGVRQEGLSVPMI